MRAFGLVLACAVMGATAAQGQGRARVAVAASVQFTRAESALPALRQTMSGVSVGTAARLDLGWVAFGLQYKQGSLRSAPGAPKKDLVEGGVALGLRPVPWLTFALNPRARSYVSAGSTERWVLVDGSVRAEPRIIGSAVRTYVETFRTVAGSVNTFGGFGGERGVEAGLLFGLPGTPIAGQIGYRVERGRLADGSRTETVEHVVVGLGLGRW